MRSPKGQGSLHAFTVCQGARGSPTKGSIDLNAGLHGLRKYQRYSTVSTHQSRPMFGMPCWSVSKDSIGIWYDRETKCRETLLLSVTAPIVVAVPGAWGHAHGDAREVLCPSSLTPRASTPRASTPRASTPRAATIPTRARRLDRTGAGVPHAKDACL